MSLQQIAICWTGSLNLRQTQIIWIKHWFCPSSWTKYLFRLLAELNQGWVGPKLRVPEPGMTTAHIEWLLSMHDLKEEAVSDLTQYSSLIHKQTPLIHVNIHVSVWKHLSKWVITRHVLWIFNFSVIFSPVFTEQRPCFAFPSCVLSPDKRMWVFTKRTERQVLGPMLHNFTNKWFITKNHITLNCALYKHCKQISALSRLPRVISPKQSVRM